MSDYENESTTPSKQTSSVPLKKETIRVSLQGVDTPPAVPSATVSMAPTGRLGGPTGAPTGRLTSSGGAPMATGAGGAPRPPAPAPTIALRKAGAPTMAPAPTIRLASATPTGAIRPAAPGATGMVLPKATVQLQTPTQPLGTSFSSTTQAATLQGDDEDEETGGGLMKLLAFVGFAAALVVLSLQLMTANTWINAEGNTTKGDWMQLFS
jgi:hypothetical protein